MCLYVRGKVFVWKTWGGCDKAAGVCMELPGCMGDIDVRRAYVLFPGVYATAYAVERKVRMCGR